MSTVDDLSMDAATNSARRGEFYWHWGAPGYSGKVRATRWAPIPELPAPPLEVSPTEDNYNG